jgi:hypothetical protein
MPNRERSTGMSGTVNRLNSALPIATSEGTTSRYRRPDADSASQAASVTTMIAIRSIVTGDKPRVGAAGKVIRPVSAIAPAFR